MEGFHGFVENWISVLHAVGIISGFIFTALALRKDAKSRQIANLLTITSNHRQIWREFYLRPDLVRVQDPSADPTKKGLTPAEEEFVNFVILHLSSVYYATRDELVIKLDGLMMDVGSFFSLPIPRAHWEKTKKFQNSDFVDFVEKCCKKPPIA